MTKIRKVNQFGSIGITIPKAACDILGWKLGDELKIEVAAKDIIRVIKVKKAEAMR